MTGPPYPASAELIALAARARPDWHSDDMRDALARARYDAMTWGQILICMGRLMADPSAVPADLAAAAPEAWRRRRPAPPAETYARGVATARAQVEAFRTKTTDLPDTHDEGHRP